MPIMTPLANMIGITRLTAVLAFQLEDAFTNVMAPTGGEILAALAMCGTISFKTWMKYLAPLFALWWLILSYSNTNTIWSILIINKIKNK